MAIKPSEQRVTPEELRSLLASGESLDVEAYFSRRVPPVGMYVNQQGERAVLWENPFSNDLNGFLIDGSIPGESRFFSVSREKLTAMLANEEVVRVFP